MSDCEKNKLEGSSKKQSNECPKQPKVEVAMSFSEWKQKNTLQAMPSKSQQLTRSSKPKRKIPFNKIPPPHREEMSSTLPLPLPTIRRVPIKLTPQARGLNANARKPIPQNGWVLKPLKPEPGPQTPELKVQWRDYRVAMKPFKNHDFHNAKRIVQRLGKKDFNELDEKNQRRLQDAQKTISEHKELLDIKHRERNNNSGSGQTRVYVRQKGTNSYRRPQQGWNEQVFRRSDDYMEPLYDNGLGTGSFVWGGMMNRYF